MKLFLSVLFLASTTAGLAQSQPSVGVLTGTSRQQPTQVVMDPQSFAWFGPGNQTDCPIKLTGAHLNWPASYLPVTSAEKVSEPNLALNFLNPSGKAIRSVSITARFLGKHNIYQLDASAFGLRLTFSGVDAADKAAEQLREIRLPEKMYAYGVTRVSLDKVNFADGSFWMASGANNCSLNVRGSAERVEAK